MPALSTVQGNQGLLVTMVHNLLANVIKFSNPGGLVQVQAGSRAGSFVLAITNQGLGIPPEDVPHLFEKFYRSAEAKKAAIPGTGLGLVLAKHVVDQHHGSISVLSRPDMGTRFTVMLPLIESQDISWEGSPSGTCMTTEGPGETARATMSGAR